MRTVRLKARGLVTNPNRLDPDETGLETATNLVSDRPGVLRPRRGFDAGTAVTSARNMHKMFSYSGAVLLNWDDDASSHKLSYSSGGAWTTIANNFEAPSTKKMRGAIVAQNLYLTSSAGILRVDDNWAPEFAGAPAGIGCDKENSTLTTDTAGPLETEKQVAYRYCLSFTDEQGRVVRGAASGRTVIRNTDATNKKRVQVRVLLPKKNGTASTALTTSYTLTVYRSSNSADLTTAPPSDERVIYEAPLTSTNITNGYVDVVDTTPDLLRGSAWPENTQNDGIVQSNYSPPFANEVVSWKGCLVGLNLTTRWRLELQILSVAGSHGIADTDTLTVNDGSTSFTVTAKTTPGASTDYLLENTGSAFLDIELTAQNLCAAINRHASNTIVYAFYAGVPEDPATLGKVVLEGRTAFGSNSFGVAVGSGDKTACFEPVLTATYTDTVASRDNWPDGWFFSKPGAPDAVPTLNLDANLGRLGTGETILCAAALEDSLFVFTDKSTWRVTGDPPTGFGDLGTLSFEVFRSTLKCLASESVQAVGGAVYALTNQGVVALNDSGVRNVSLEIEDLVRSFSSDDGTGYQDSTEDTAFAVGHDTERMYMLWLTSSEQGAQTILVYNLASDSWTQWEYEAACGVLDAETDRVWLAKDNASSNATVHKQKDVGVHTDGTGEGSDISCILKWLPVVAPQGQPKHFREAALLFEPGGSQPSAAFTFQTEIASATVTATSNGLGAARTMVPRTAARGHRLSVSVTMTADTWVVSGLAVVLRPYGERLGE